ncbi:hypothetical protein MBAV_003884 [Candidatus Magnetobacterium bavaricum]|uniref:Uncharacterized protein n=1 Tax=Candidatus Magnetobacterium bavaricum TaxID=29290 RepID=A0A0F3GQ28_9BACT|nr:hypothetical protein MBAV_003884 [Candidatus Magnetobacterium bavaricum]
MDKYNKHKVWEEVKGQITGLIENKIDEIEEILTKQNKVVITIKLAIRDETDGVYSVASKVSVARDAVTDKLETIMIDTKPGLFDAKESVA